MSIQLESSEDKQSAVEGHPPRWHLDYIFADEQQKVRFCLEMSPLLSAHPISESKDTNKNKNGEITVMYSWGEIFLKD